MSQFKNVRLSPSSQSLRRRLGLESLESRRLFAVDTLPTIPELDPQLTDISSVVDSQATVVGGWGSSMYQYSFNDPMTPDDKYRAPSTTSNEAVDASIVDLTDSADEESIATHGYIRIKKLNSGG